MGFFIRTSEFQLRLDVNIFLSVFQPRSVLIDVLAWKSNKGFAWEHYTDVGQKSEQKVYFQTGLPV